MTCEKLTFLFKFFLSFEKKQKHLFNGNLNFLNLKLIYFKQNLSLKKISFQNLNNELLTTF